MKKQLLLLVAAAALSWNAGAAEVKAGPSLSQVMQAGNAVKLKAVHSASIVYEVEGGKAPLSRMVFNISGDKKLRIDLISAKSVLTICRDGDKYWGFEKSRGVYDLSPEEVDALACDLAVCPFADFKENVFLPLVPNGEGVSGSKNCQIYETSLPNDANFVMTVWQDKESLMPATVKINYEGGRFSVSFLDYKEFDGIKLATRVNSSGKNGVTRFKLLAAQFNPELDAELFKPADPSNSVIVLTTQRTLEEMVKAKETIKAQAAKENKAKADAAAKAKENTPEAQRAKTEKLITQTKINIQKLDIMIADKEKILEKLEQIASTGQNKAAEVASKSTGSNSGWNYYGWYRSGSNASHTQRQVAKQLIKSSKQAAEEYEKVNKELTDLKLKRVDYQTYLERLEASLK